MSTHTRLAGLAEAKERFEKEVGYCEHQCTSNCRREGCNCSDQCGEYHVDKEEQFTNWLEENN